MLARMRAALRRLARFVAAAAGAILVALILLEILLRIGLYEALPIPIEASIFTMDAPGKLRLRPNVDVRSRGGEWDVRYVTNASGLRDGERESLRVGSWGERLSAARQDVKSPWPRVAILGLGDSFTFGWGVPFEATYLIQGERALLDETRRPAICIAAAVPGWGPTDELAWLRENWDDWAPSLLLLGFVAGNDFFDTMVGGARQFEVVEGLQIPKSRNRGGIAAIRAPLRRYSALYRAIAALSPGVEMRLATRGRQILHWPVNDIYRRIPPAETTAAIDSTLRVLDAIRAFASERGATFAVTVIPGRAQVHAEDFSLFKSRFGFADADLDMAAPQRALRGWADARGVPLLDLAPPMRAAAAADTTRLYFRNDSHWTPAGHALAGRLVARFLIDRALVPADSARGPADPG